MRRLSLLTLVLLSLTASALHAQENIPFMDLDELRILLKNGPVPAQFKTVSSGDQPVLYDIEVRDILDESGLSIIMFTTGQYIAGGMSGSPVYLTGADKKTRKLLGALAYNFGEFPLKQKWGGISPIVEMQKESSDLYSVLGALAKKQIPIGTPQSFTYKGMVFTPIPTGTRVLTKPSEYPGQIDSSPEITVVSTSVQGTQAPVSGKDVLLKSHKLEPGMPIIVDLFYWVDIKTDKVSTMGAMGTITHVGPKGEIYAFGHPFLGAKFSVYPIRTCKVIGTVWNQQHSFKLQGEASEVLGFIGFDGKYGIYGSTDLNLKPKPDSILASFRWENNLVAAYKIFLARTPFQERVMSMALETVGDLAGAPASEQTSTTDMKAQAYLDSGEEIVFEEITQSVRLNLGPFSIRKSSYENAWQSFIERVLIPLDTSAFDVSVSYYNMAFNFWPGKQKVLFVADVRFPNKVQYGSVPVLEILLASKDNKELISRKIPIPIDWSKVEMPRYDANTNYTEKQNEKKILGTLRVFDITHFNEFLLTSDSEKRKERPSYYINRQEFLQEFLRKLARTNKQLFIRASLQQRSGLFEQAFKETKLAIPEGGREDSGWTIYSNGLKDRPASLPDTDQVVFSVDPEPVPGSYMLSDIENVFPFEVVK